jgi:hypothetical protein
MTVIRTYEDESELRNDADALDAIELEVERIGASGADVAALVAKVIAASKDGYGTGISTSRPVAALLTTDPVTEPQVFPGYWQRDGSWRDVESKPDGVGLAETIAGRLSGGDAVTPGAAIKTVSVQFHSFSGGSPTRRSWQRGAVEDGIELPRCPD